MARELNRTTNEKTRTDLANAMRAGGWLLGLLQGDPEAWFVEARTSDALDEEAISALLQERESARTAGNFQEADRIRDELADRGIAIEDGPEGSRWRRGR